MGVWLKEIRVFLVDDQEIFREGLARLLQEQPYIQLVCQCGNNPRIFEQVKATEPDVLLIDIDINQLDSLESFQKISHISPGTRIAIFTDNRRKDHFLRAMQMGARGYLSKDVPIEELIGAINLIARGEIIISPAFSRQFFFPALRFQSRPGSVTGKTGLSRREIEVLRLVTSGATNKEIAENLYIAENTVKVHLKKILDKLQLRNRQQLAAYAVRQGLTANVRD
jgi:DNA-binding NarL/FixJ family response regulator